MWSNCGSVAHFFIPLGETSSGKTSDTREVRLPVGELSYPLLDMENWRATSPWESSLESGREGDLGRGKLFPEILLAREGLLTCTGSDGVSSVDFSSLSFSSGTPLSSWEFPFCLIRPVFWTCKI